jgi:ligand-binding sensor domain-containing protein
MTSLVQLRTKKYCSLFIVFLCFGAFGQHVKNYTMADGLPGNSIKCLFKDSKGLIWIATETGLCTYNGSEFKIIGNEQGLYYNSVWDITEDDKKNIWLSVYGYGVAKFDGRKFCYFSKKDGLINNSVRRLFFSKKNQCMVFGTECGISIFNGEKFKNFDLKKHKKDSNKQVNFISEIGNDIVFNVSYENLFKIKTNKNQLEKSTLIRLNNLGTQNYAGLIQGMNYIGRNLESEFEIQNLQSKQKRTYGTCSNIWDFTTSKTGIYAATWDGNSPNGAILYFEKGVLSNLTEKLNLPTSKFWKIMFDKQTQQLWVGSIDKGVFIIDLNNKIQAENIQLGNTLPEINSLFLDKNQNLWIGGNDFILKRTKDNKINALNTKDIIEFLQKNSKKHPENNRVFDVIKAQQTIVFQTIKGNKNGTIWAFTNFGLFCFNQDLAIIQHLYIHETSGVFEFISPEKIFLSHAYTLSYLVPINRSAKIKEVKLNGKKIRLDANRIFKSNNKLWIASWSKGLYLLENEKLIALNQLGNFVGNNVVDVIEAENQTLIFGTVNGKVYFSKWQHQQLKHLKILYPDKDIIGNSIFFIRKYKNFYFIGTNKGLNIVKNYKLYKFINQDENLPQTTYTDACIDHINKKFYISSYKGIVGIDLPKILTTENLNSPIRLNQIKVNGIIVPTSRNLNLNYHQNTLEFEFSSNNSYNAKKNYFTYKIVGLTNNWSELSTANNLKLFDLKSGIYQLTIKGKNIGTNEKLQPLHLQIIIHPPFWETWWFLGLLIASVLSLITLFIRQKINQIKNKSAIEKRIAETKLQALQSQMNPHFVFNAMNSIQNFVIDNQTDEALSYIGEFSKLIRQTLNFSSRTCIRLEEELEFLQRYIGLENLRRNNKVTVQLTSADEIDLNELEIPPMLLQPLIENVFIHAFDQHTINPTLTVDFYLKVDTLICRISDNGKGIQPNNLAAINSKGIKLVDERIRLLSNAAKQMIQFEAHPTIGTSIIISIPLR